MNRAIHAASAGQCGIGRIGHRVHRDPRDVAFLQNDLSSRRARPVHTIYYNHFMTRRELLAAGAAFATCATPLRAAKTHIDKSRISAITDEIGLSTGGIHRVRASLRDAECRNPQSPGQEGIFHAARSGNQGRRRPLRQRGTQGHLRQHQPAQIHLARHRGRAPPHRNARSPRQAPRRRKSALGPAHGRFPEGHPLRPHHGLRQGARLRRHPRGRPHHRLPDDRRHPGRDVQAGGEGKGLPPAGERRLAERRHRRRTRRRHEADSLQMGGLSTGIRTTPTARRKPIPKAIRCCPRTAC